MSAFARYVGIDHSAAETPDSMMWSAVSPLPKRDITLASILSR
jgi:hypothetical protein